MDVPEPVLQAAATATNVGVDDIRAILIEGNRKSMGRENIYFTSRCHAAGLGSLKRVRSSCYVDCMVRRLSSPFSVRAR